MNADMINVDLWQVAATVEGFEGRLDINEIIAARNFGEATTTLMELIREKCAKNRDRIPMLNENLYSILCVKYSRTVLFKSL